MFSFEDWFRNWWCWLGLQCSCGPNDILGVSISISGIKEGVVSTQLQDDQQVVASAAGVTGGGNTVPLPSGTKAVWTSSDESILTIATDPNDSTKATVIVTGTLGDASVSAVATLPDGTVLPKSNDVPISVVAGSPKTVQVSLGAPVAKPAA